MYLVLPDILEFAVELEKEERVLSRWLGITEDLVKQKVRLAVLWRQTAISSYLIR
jgi:hypothetical protein